MVWLILNGQEPATRRVTYHGIYCISAKKFISKVSFNSIKSPTISGWTAPANHISIVLQMAYRVLSTIFERVLSSCLLQTVDLILNWRCGLEFDVRNIRLEL